MKKKLFGILLIVTLLICSAAPVLAQEPPPVVVEGVVYDKILTLENKTPSTTAPWATILGDDIDEMMGFDK